MEKIVEILTGNGAVGISIAMLFYMYYKDKAVNQMITEYNKIINEYFVRDVEARKEETESRLEIAKAISKLAGNVANCPTNTMLSMSKKKSYKY